MQTRLSKVYEVNPQELARITGIIKGFMTSAELAKKLGVNPSTTSRMLNGKISGPISEDTIRKLADMITPDMGVSREELFKANGMVEDIGSGYRGYHTEFDERRRMESDIEEILIHELWNRSASAWRYSDRLRYTVKEGMLSARPNLVVECGECHNGNHPYNCNWAFIYLETTPYVGGKSSWDLRTAMRFVERMSSLALMYQQVTGEEAQYDDEFQELPAKISGVVYRPELYDSIVNKYANLRLPMPTSLVLINLEEHRVEKEFPFSDLNGYRYQSVFDGSYFDDDGNSISEEEYDAMLEEMIDEMAAEEMANSKEEDN